MIRVIWDGIKSENLTQIRGWGNFLGDLVRICSISILKKWSYLTKTKVIFDQEPLLLSLLQRESLKNCIDKICLDSNE